MGLHVQIEIGNKEIPMFKSLLTASSIVAVLLAISTPTLASPGLTNSDKLDGKSSSEVAKFNDPRWEDQWYLKQQQFDYIYPKLKKDIPIKVAVIDSTIDHSIKDFQGVPFHKGFMAFGMEFGNPKASSYRSKSRQEVVPCLKNGNVDGSCEHGTAVASVIASQINNGHGMVGIVPNVEIIESGLLLSGEEIGKAATPKGDLAEAIDRSIELGAKVINLSVIQSVESLGLRDVLEKAESRGVVVVASAGNNAAAGVQYPAKMDSVIAVGAHDSEGKPTDWSARGAELDISAAGSGVLVHWNESKNTYGSGTSFAAPIVAATAALMFQQDPNLTPAQVRERLYSTALDKPAGGKDSAVGHGRLNMAGALGIHVPEEIKNPRDNNPPAPKPTESVPPPYQPIVSNPRNPIRRLGGQDRIETAIEVSRSYTNRNDESYVVIARADDFADTIAAGSIAKIHQAPLLITNSNFLHPSVKSRLNEVQTRYGKVIIVGGTKAISSKVEDELRAMGRNVVRISGKDRIDTSIKIAEYVGDQRGYNDVNHDKPKRM